MTIGAYSVRERAYLAALTKKLENLHRKSDALIKDLREGGWPETIIWKVETIKYIAQEAIAATEVERGRK
jgi:hypothetical protein